MVYELFIDHEVSSGMIWDIVCVVKKFMCIEQGGMGGCIEQGDGKYLIAAMQQYRLV